MEQDSRNGPITGINIIPLVDIALVLLIIFMVSSTLLLNPSLEVNLPKASTGDANTGGLLKVTLSKEGYLDVNGQPVTLAALQSIFIKHKIENPSIQIKADKEVAHGTVIQVIDLARAAGINRFAFMVERREP